MNVRKPGYVWAGVKKAGPPLELNDILDVPER